MGTVPIQREGQPDRYEPLRSVRSQGTHRPRGGMRFMTSVMWMICPAIAVLMIPPVILQAPVITDVTNGRDRIYQYIGTMGARSSNSNKGKNHEKYPKYHQCESNDVHGYSSLG